MSFQEYVRVLVRRGWILLLAAIVVAGSAFIFSSFQTPLYKSTVDILIQPASNDFGLSQSAKLFLNSYVAYLNTNARAQEVIDRLQLDTSPDALRSGVRMEAELDKFFIKIEVISDNGELANQIANDFGQVLVEWRNAENQRQRREDRVTAQILDQPRYSLYAPRTLLNTIAGGLLGVLLGAVVIFVLEYLEASVLRSRADVERAVTLPVLGNIPPAH